MSDIPADHWGAAVDEDQTPPEADAASVEQLSQELAEQLRRADERDHIADEREKLADERERVADERERLADERERRLDEREASVDERARQLTR